MKREDILAVVLTAVVVGVVWGFSIDPAVAQKFAGYTMIALGIGMNTFMLMLEGYRYNRVIHKYPHHDDTYDADKIAEEVARINRSIKAILISLFMLVFMGVLFVFSADFMWKW